MRIEALHLRDIGPFRDTTIEFPEGTDPERADVHLLIGENGTGKTTILRALSAAFDASAHADLAKRFTTDDGLVAVRWSMGVVGVGQRRGRVERPLPVTFGDLTLLSSGSEQVWFGSEGERASLPLRASMIADQHPALFAEGAPDLVAISFAGGRLTASTGVEGTRPIKSNPLRCWQAGGQGRGSTEVAQWLINTRVRASAARDEGDLAGAESFERYLKSIEAALTKMVGRPTVIRVPARTLDAQLEIDGQRIALDLLPDGLRALLAWVADVAMRLERIPGHAGVPIEQREFLLLLDEVEVHLHPRWQRRVLHTFQALFPRARVVASTHSPFVVNSIADGFLHVLERDDDGSILARTAERAEPGSSVHAILAEVLGVREEFGEDVEPKLADLIALRDRCLRGEQVRAELDALADDLRNFGTEVGSLVDYHLRVLDRRLAEGA